MIGLYEQAVKLLTFLQEERNVYWKYMEIYGNIYIYIFYTNTSLVLISRLECHPLRVRFRSLQARGRKR